MNFTVTTLVDNTAPMGKGLIGEHGISFYIETTDGRKILFDTGQGLALSHNAEKLSIDLKEIDTVVLSHGHYDHTGGLASLIKCNTDFTLIAHPDVFSDKLALRHGKYIHIGMSISKKQLEENKIALKLEKQSVQIAPNIITTGEISMETDFEAIEPAFFVRKNKKEFPDTLADDQALIINTKKGLVILLGCSHRGLINILNQAIKLTGNNKIYAVIGGMHLSQASDNKLKKIIRSLHGFNIAMIGLSHCTGIKAVIAIFNEFKDKAFLNTVGQTVKF